MLSTFRFNNAVPPTDRSANIIQKEISGLKRYGQEPDISGVFELLLEEDKADLVNF